MKLDRPGRSDKMPLLRKNVNRSPLWTVAELAREFGVDTRSLQMAIRWAKDAPAPISHHREGKHRSRLFRYNPTEMRAWWKRRLIAASAVNTAKV